MGIIQLLQDAEIGGKIEVYGSEGEIIEWFYVDKIIKGEDKVVRLAKICEGKMMLQDYVNGILRMVGEIDEKDPYYGRYYKTILRARKEI